MPPFPLFSQHRSSRIGVVRASVLGHSRCTWQLIMGRRKHEVASSFDGGCAVYDGDGSSSGWLGFCAINGGAASAGGTFSCRILNADSIAREISAITIRRYAASQNSTTSILPTVNTCGGTIGAGKACTVSAPIGNASHSYFCVLNLVDSATHLRGTAEIASPAPKSILVTAPITRSEFGH